VEQLQQDTPSRTVDRLGDRRELGRIRVVVDEAVVAPAGSDAADRRAAGDD